MIVSELSALTKDSIQREYLKLTSSYVLKEEKTSMKAAFRKRDIYITEAIRKRLDILTARTTSNFLLTSSRGTRLNSTDFATLSPRGVSPSESIRCVW